ncbi:MAG TPA: response regulator [Candidatus Omnitrophota bacterium]|nr:response regulator [Candidatus Omnitrophota bacterium]HPD85159.1 response regulator [Candidatus Omnitrophota bacterium]HRZ04340.1 response regulator [Candidatus Omnitrophota bacterium]
MADKIKILMIDDEPDLCTLVKANLEETGEFEVVTTTQPQEAESLCLRENPNLILLDNIMPSRKGADIAKALKGNADTKNIPIIMVSGKGEMVYSRKKGQFQWLPNNPLAVGRGQISDAKDAEGLAKSYGVDDYVSKPFKTELLIEVIKDVLARRKPKDEEENG